MDKKLWEEIGTYIYEKYWDKVWIYVSSQWLIIKDKKD